MSPPSLDSTIPVESDTDDEGAPRISLAEMIEDLHISQDATGEEGASMMSWWAMVYAVCVSVTSEVSKMIIIA